MTKDLFRKEAIRHRTRALYGDVVLATPRPLWILTFLLALVLAILVGFCLFGHINIDGVNIPVWRWAAGIS